ncbi:MAG: protein CapI [Candidatus Yonathbacteria bacterium RIFOXYC1_FULL_52_10]|uniref:Protein CapI n=1 Tax=Candidatus Yonathbacteria bacterium RIFOXYD1_FULL_52_36 TaxID=1802730 RepID=A0A1G2SKV1_9BACT|nr:MAG: protein CapI [Candidatus Yonathbacteria bacterium RIFOXYC1_FULL_52_10]OHA85670.1 MAG: protein CapI [Candidatus Yonathbacteria bacterium RIFOXYD1_FULL_52_36]
MTQKKHKKILITGTAGFIGYHLAESLLKDGYSVVGVDNFTPYYDVRMKEARHAMLQKNKNFHFYKISIAEYAALEKVVKKEKPDVIVNLAAQAGVRFSLKNPWSYADSNYLGTLNVFEVAQKHNIKRVLFASSSSVYGDNKKMPFSETDATDHPMSVYAASKKGNETLAYAYHSLYGIETAGMRFFTVYGRYGRPDLALFKFTKNIIAGKTIDVYNHGKMKRSFTHINDVVRGVRALIEKEKLTYEVYNLGGDEATSLLGFIKMIEKRIGKKAVMNLMPIQAGDVPATIADTTKAKRDLGYQPKVSMKEGIADFVDWFLEHKAWLLKLKEPMQ